MARRLWRHINDAIRHGDSDVVDDISDIEIDVTIATRDVSTVMSSAVIDVTIDVTIATSDVTTVKSSVPSPEWRHVTSCVTCQ